MLLPPHFVDGIETPAFSFIHYPLAQRGKCVVDFKFIHTSFVSASNHFGSFCSSVFVVVIVVVFPIGLLNIMGEGKNQNHMVIVGRGNDHPIM